jgi:hypothetical protein
MHNALQHINDDKLTSALTYRTIVGSVLTPLDVHNARRLSGPCLACAAGRTRRPHYMVLENEPAQAVGDVVHADIYILNTETIGGNKYFLISLDEFSAYLHVTPMKSKSKGNLTEAFDTLLAFYKSFKFDIKLIQTDHEAKLWSCKNHINMRGTRLMQVGPYQHAKRMERYIHVCKYSYGKLSS